LGRLPAADEDLQQALVGRGKLIGAGELEVLRLVKGGAAVVAGSEPVLVRRAIQLIAVNVTRAAGAIVQSMRPGVRGSELKPVGKTLADRDQERVVPGDAFGLIEDRVRAVAKIGRTQVGVAAGRGIVRFVTVDLIAVRINLPVNRICWLTSIK